MIFVTTLCRLCADAEKAHSKKSNKEFLVARVATNSFKRGDSFFFNVYFYDNSLLKLQAYLTKGKLILIRGNANLEDGQLTLYARDIEFAPERREIIPPKDLEET